MQGFLRNRLSKRSGEEKLPRIGPILMATETLLMPIFQNVTISFLANTALAAGFGIINITIPAFLSKKNFD